MADEQQRVAMLSAAAPSNGSRTVTITETNAQTTQPASSSTSGTLHLRGASGNDSRRVAWSEETVDNEGMGKKKSKICCIYHKPKAFDESSDESSSSGSSDEDSDESASSHSSRSSTASGVNASKALRAKRAATTAAAEKANQTSTDNGHQHDDGCTPNHSHGTRKGKKSRSHRYGARSGGSRTLTELVPPTEADHDDDDANSDRQPGKPKSNAYERGPA